MNKKSRTTLTVLATAFVSLFLLCGFCGLLGLLLPPPDPAVVAEREASRAAAKEARETAKAQKQLAAEQKNASKKAAAAEASDSEAVELGTEPETLADSSSQAHDLADSEPVSEVEPAGVAKESAFSRLRKGLGGLMKKDPSAAEAVPELGTNDRLDSEVRKALGASNRDVPKVSIIEHYEQHVLVRFTIDQNLTDRLTKLGAKADICDCLQAIQKSQADVESISIQATIELADKFGNGAEEKVIQTTYSRSQVDKINWPNFLTDNILEVADDAWVHPAFR